MPTKRHPLLRISCVWRSNGGCCDLANIPVIADVLFTETVENFVLPSTELLDPFAHVVQHFTLDLGAAIMEIWMEAKAA